MMPPWFGTIHVSWNCTQCFFNPFPISSRIVAAYHIDDYVHISIRDPSRWLACKRSLGRLTFSSLSDHRLGVAWVHRYGRNNRWSPTDPDRANDADPCMVSLSLMLSLLKGGPSRSMSYDKSVCSLKTICGQNKFYWENCPCRFDRSGRQMRPNQPNWGLKRSASSTRSCEPMLLVFLELAFGFRRSSVGVYACRCGDTPVGCSWRVQNRPFESHTNDSWLGFRLVLDSWHCVRRECWTSELGLCFDGCLNSQSLSLFGKQPSSRTDITR